jgi:hypothetical protein
MVTRTVSFTALLATLGVGIATGMLLMSPARTLEDNRQILSGGNSVGPGAILFSGPGMSNIYNANFPGPGQGEGAAQIRLPPGELTALRVNVHTENPPTPGGKLNVMVRVNGTNSKLSCSVAGPGDCTSMNTVILPKESRVTIRVTNTLIDAGFVTFTYSMTYD